MMSDLRTDTPMQAPSDVEDPHGEQRTPRWSLLAIAAFVLSFLLALAPIGVVLGGVGILVTHGGRRRGRGLAIAAIPIGIMMTGMTTILALGIYIASQTSLLGSQVTDTWKGSRADIPSRSTALYEKCSDRFRDAVSGEAFEAWAAGVAEKHGSLQGTKRSAQAITSAVGTTTMHVTGQFVNGPADIAITFAFPSFTPEVDGLAIDGVSPKSNRQGDASDGD